MSTVQVLDPRFAAVAEGASTLQRLCTGAAWSEGPVWMRETAELLWSDIPNNRMLCWHAERGLREAHQVMTLTRRVTSTLDAADQDLACAGGVGEPGS